MIIEMTHEEYLKRPEIGSSNIKEAVKTLAHFKAQMDKLTPFKESKAMDIGTAAHAAILERDYSKYVKGPDVDKRTKPWKEFVAANQDKVVLDSDAFNQIEGMYREFYKHPRASKLMNGGKPEVSIVWTPEFVKKPCKARLDYYVGDDSSGDYIIDYKTARSASPDEFAKAVYNFRYDISAAHYINAVEEGLKREVKHYIWIVQENVAPYLVNVYVASPDLLARAKNRWGQLLENIDKAYSENNFPGYDSEIKELDIPSWAINKELEYVQR